jgi:transcription antitermination factor NusA-like protein
LHKNIAEIVVKYNKNIRCVEWVNDITSSSKRLLT